MYFFVAAVFLAGFLLIYRIIHSPFGEVLKAIRENEPRAISLGYKTDRYKLARLRAVGDARRPRRRDQGDRVPARLAHRRALDHVGRGGADDAGRRAWHRLRAGGRRVSSSPWRTISPVRPMGDRSSRASIFVVCVLLFRRGVVGDRRGRTTHPAVNMSPVGCAKRGLVRACAPV